MGTDRADVCVEFLRCHCCVEHGIDDDLVLRCVERFDQRFDGGAARVRQSYQKSIATGCAAVAIAPSGQSTGFPRGLMATVEFVTTSASVVWSVIVVVSVGSVAGATVDELSIAVVAADVVASGALLGVPDDEHAANKRTLIRAVAGVRGPRITHHPSWS